MEYGFSFNGTHSNAYDLVMKSKNRQALPSTNDVYLQVPARDGSYLVARELNDRTIDVQCAVLKASLSDLRMAMRNISAWLNTKSKVQLIFDDEPDKYYLAKLDGAIDLNQTFTLGEFGLRFRCEPYAYAIATKTQNFVSDAISITNAGTASVFPKFTATFTAAATEFKVWLGNYYIRVVRNFVIGDILVIDNAISKVTVNGLNIMVNLDLGSRFFSIGSGTTNLSITPVTVANMTIAWKERWL